MIKTNNQEYKNYDIKVIWRNVYISNNDKKRSRKDPFINFNIDNPY